MLEADEIDDDYFTPVPSTSLASIFTNKRYPRNNEEGANESLKYTPPKPQNVTKPTVESKVTDCLLACVLFAYEWLGDNYTAKGKIGFAIIRNNKNNNHDIVLYDSNKRTLSCATATSYLEVKIKGGHYVSYHDNLKKYWTLYATEEEVTKIVDMLKPLSVEIKYCSHSSDSPPEPNKPENIENEIQKEDVVSKESDTDSSINTKTKMSVLNRMACMGQSVLPRQVISTDRTSDSSDTETIHSKTMKHKLTKGIVKRMLDKPQPAPEVHPTPETSVQTLLPQSLINPLYTFSANGQLVSLDKNNISIRNDSGNDINSLMSEQRICNSELRINMGRLTDKMDQVLDRIKNSNNTSSNVEVDLYKKLITEYEYKIKMYEDMLLKHNNNSTKTYKELLKESQNNELAAFQSTIDDKNKEIFSLKQELEDLKRQQNELISTNYKIETNLREELVNVKKNLASKEEELNNMMISKSIPPNITESSSDMEQKLKSVMNETFQTISSHFESDGTYSGSTVKGVIAAIIKKVTLNSIKE